MALVFAATVVQAISRQTFLVRAGRIGQDMLFELRRRVFGHFQRLSPAFHDDYTSGRVISRQTSDMDAIYEMLETGFDGLVTAVLTLVGVAVLLLVLDVQARPGRAAAASRSCCWLTNWFRRESAKTYRVTREKVALVIVHFVESMLGIRAVQAFRREPRNQEIFEDVNDQYRVANVRAFRLVAWFMPGIKLIGNITISIILLYGAYLAFEGEVTVGVLAAFLLYLRQFFEPMQEISQFYNTFQSASAGAGEAVRACSRRSRRVPEPATPTPLPQAPRRGPLRACASSPTARACRCSPALDLARPGRADGRPGRHHRRRQDHDRQAAVPLLRPDDGRVLLDGVDLRQLDEPDAAPGGRDGDPGELPVRRHGRRQHPLRPARSATLEEVGRRPRRRSAPTSSSPGCPQGYDTDVANKGGRLSAGQRQLVAFARAFLADPACSSSTRRPLARRPVASGWCSGPCAPSSPSGPR